MHELSLAQNILEIVQQYVPKGQEKSVKTIKLRIGELAAVVPESLEFCFSSIVAGTLLSDSTLEIERVPFTLECRKCNSTVASRMGIVVCPRCGSEDTEVIAGTEMRVVEIELWDPVAETI
ncbi:MAG TPA: hydrogenase maturation nickel metallochaperone HypA [Bacteroidota bacterium]